MRHHPNEYADSPKNDKCHQIANKIPVIVTFMTKHQQQREKKRKLRTLGGDGPLSSELHSFAFHICLRSVEG